MIANEALAIANARGVPGTAAAVVTSNGARCVLTCHHVLFGDGARRGDRVWALPPDDDDGPPVLLGRTATGELGRIGDSRQHHFVDFALVALEPIRDTDPPWLRAALDALVFRSITTPLVGSELVKHGATTGRTRGTLASDDYVTEPWLEGRAWTASGQLLVDSSDDSLVFSAAGDSGAALVDRDGSMVGLLWGTTVAGQGIACPIAPIVAHLGVEL